MKMSSISGVTCYSADINRTAEFYEALGFRPGNRKADQVTFYVNWFWVTFLTATAEKDPRFVKEAASEHKGTGIFLCIKVEDINEFYEGVLSKGMKPEDKPQKRASGNREFVLLDPDGYRLTFFEKK